MRMRLVVSTALALAALLAAATSPADAKGFRPGDLSICDKQHCVPIMDRKVTDALSLFYYAPGSQPTEVRKPRLGVPYFQIKSGPSVSGVVATSQLDRFRTGCQCGNFGPDDWYRVPAKIARYLRKLAANLKPLRVSESVVVRTRYG
jgi:hypothetical protein